MCTPPSRATSALGVSAPVTHYNAGDLKLPPTGIHWPITCDKQPGDNITTSSHSPRYVVLNMYIEATQMLIYKFGILK